MKASKFSDAQKAFILKQGDDGVPAAQLAERSCPVPERTLRDTARDIIRGLLPVPKGYPSKRS